MGPWWGHQPYEQGQTFHWQIGPRNLWISRLEGEWRVASGLEKGASGRPSAPPARCNEYAEASDVEVRRFAANPESLRVRVAPALPDRPLVVRPMKPISVLRSRTVTLYVSTPLWIRLFIDEDDQPVIDDPVFRPSDTWFGSDTTQGSLCYASRTKARLKLTDLTPSAYRAVTAIKVENQSSTILHLERMRVPVASLSLYSDEGGDLWTDGLTLRQDDRSGADVILTPQGSVSSKLTRLTEPRTQRSKATLFDAFSGRLTSAGSNV